MLGIQEIQLNNASCQSRLKFYCRSGVLREYSRSMCSCKIVVCDSGVSWFESRKVSYALFFLTSFFSLAVQVQQYLMFMNVFRSNCLKSALFNKIWCTVGDRSCDI